MTQKKTGLELVTCNIKDSIVVHLKFGLLAIMTAHQGFSFFNIDILRIKSRKNVLGMVLVENLEHGPGDFVAQSRGNGGIIRPQLPLKLIAPQVKELLTKLDQVFLCV